MRFFERRSAVGRGAATALGECLLRLSGPPSLTLRVGGLFRRGFDRVQNSAEQLLGCFVELRALIVAIVLPDDFRGGEAQAETVARFVRTPPLPPDARRAAEPAGSPNRAAPPATNAFPIGPSPPRHARPSADDTKHVRRRFHTVARRKLPAATRPSPPANRAPIAASCSRSIGGMMWSPES